MTFSGKGATVVYVGSTLPTSSSLAGWRLAVRDFGAWASLLSKVLGILSTQLSPLQRSKHFFALQKPLEVAAGVNYPYRAPDSSPSHTT